MHKNIKSVNILLDDKLAVRVSECGLAPLLSSGSTSEVIMYTIVYIYLSAVQVLMI